MTTLRDLDPTVLLRACHLFFEHKLPTQAISDDVAPDLRRLHPDFEMSREKVYEPYKAQRKSRPDLLKEQWPHLAPLGATALLRTLRWILLVCSSSRRRVVVSAAHPSKGPRKPLVWSSIDRHRTSRR